jgi:hypothetical protein
MSLILKKQTTNEASRQQAAIILEEFSELRLKK